MRNDEIFKAVNLNLQPVTEKKESLHFPQAAIIREVVELMGPALTYNSLSAVIFDLALFNLPEGLRDDFIQGGFLHDACEAAAIQLIDANSLFVEY